MIRVDGREARTADEFRELYGKKLREEDSTVDDFNIDLKLFSILPVGHEWKHVFCLTSMKMQWGDWLQLELRGYENYWFKRAIKALSQRRFVWLLGSSSAGKSFAAAAYVYQTWKSAPWKTSAFLSSTDKVALQGRIWGIVRKMFSYDKYQVGQRLDYRDMIVLQEDKADKDRFYENSISGVALPRGSEGEKAIGQIIGRKNAHVIWACDEMSHMEGEVIRTARGNLRSNPMFQFFGLSNKPEEGDPMYFDAEPFGDEFAAGWKTPGLDSRTWWPTKLGLCLYFDGMRSPNLDAPEDEPAPFPMLTRRDFIQETIADDGMEDGPQFWRWVKGFPKSGDIRDRVLTEAILEAFGATKEVVWAGNNYKTVAGLDLGLKADGDPCVAAFAKVGDEYEGEKVMALEESTVQLPHSLSDPSPYENQVACKFLDECEKRQCHVVAADISGSGGIMTQSIAQEALTRGYGMEIMPIDFGGSPSEDEYEIGGERKPARQLFDRRVSEVWQSLRLAVQNRKVRGVKLSAKYVRQLCERRVIQDEQKRFKVEKKRDMKKRIRRSPDDADAVCLCHMAARKAGLSKDTSILEQRAPVTITMPDSFDDERRRYRSGHYQGNRYARR